MRGTESALHGAPAWPHDHGRAGCRRAELLAV